MPQIDRRTLLKAGAATAAAGPFTGFFALQAHARPPQPAGSGPVALAPVPDLRDQVVRLHLPDGFAYRSFHHRGETLDDGTVLPGRHDGMAAFAGPGGSVQLVRNHEVLHPPGAAFTATTAVYDPAGPGGTTSARVDHEGNVLESWASLAGTQGNCSGGAMPWGSWVTCEETVNGPDVFDDFNRGSLPADTYVTNVRLSKPHGYVFEVPAGGESDAQPVRAAGRFSHEAIVFAPEDGAYYLTEDDFGFPSGFYRYVPPGARPGRGLGRARTMPGRVEDGGRLFMLTVPGRPLAHLEAEQRVGVTYPVKWVPIDDPDPTFAMAGGAPTTTNDQAIHAVAEQGWAQGAAFFARLEGAVHHEGTVYFTATQGGGALVPFDPADPQPASRGFGTGYGQIWAYHVRQQQLELVYVSPGPDVLDFPDNVTTSSSGTLVICEDSSNGNYLRGLTAQGALFDIASNAIPRGSDIGGDEFAGAAFSPDGGTLYVNIQASTGLSFAIWGPWSSIGV